MTDADGAPHATAALPRSSCISDSPSNWNHIRMRVAPFLIDSSFRRYQVPIDHRLPPVPHAPQVLLATYIELILVAPVLYPRSLPLASEVCVFSSEIFRQQLHDARAQP